MDVLTLPRLQAQLSSHNLVRQLKAQARRGGEEGRLAAERLALSPVSRPPGALVWFHAPAGIQPGPITSLVQRIHEIEPDASVLLTGPTVGNLDEPGLLVQQSPVEAIGVIGRFLDHWQPDVAVWFGAVTEPVLADSAARRGMPLLLQDAVAPEIANSRSRALQRRLLGLFERILAVDAVEAERLRGIGAFPARIESSGRLTEAAEPLGCVEAEREDLAAAFDTRPVWMAVCPTDDELEAVLTAHRNAKRTTHRLLLLIVPGADHTGPALSRHVLNAGWAVARRDADEYPEEGTDIYVADCEDEIGLYYRLAPISFLGGTLSGGPVPDPMEAAALGSAIITGPETGDRAVSLRRLGDGGACRRISDAAELSQAVSDLLEPERAAILALNGWDISSGGAQVRDRLAALIVSLLHDGWSA